MNKQTFKQAFKDTVPVMTGYLFLGFGFGILMQQNGYGILWSTAMSALIYAGSMQYVAVGLLASGAGLLTAALTTLLVNARHLFYGISMIDSYKGMGKQKPYLIFALTDETFSLVSKDSLPMGVDKKKYCLYVSLLDHLYWVFGTAIGSLAGSILPINFEGIEFVLTALFVTIFVEQWLSTEDHIPAICGALVTALCLIIFGKETFLIPSMCLITAILAGMSKAGTKVRAKPEKTEAPRSSQAPEAEEASSIHASEGSSLQPECGDSETSGAEHNNEEGKI